MTPCKYIVLLRNGTTIQRAIVNGLSLCWHAEISSAIQLTGCMASNCASLCSPFCIPVQLYFGVQYVQYESVVQLLDFVQDDSEAEC